LVADHAQSVRRDRSASVDQVAEGCASELAEREVSQEKPQGLTRELRSIVLLVLFSLGLLWLQLLVESGIMVEEPDPDQNLFSFKVLLSRVPIWV
jgi:hypothetical protein